MRLHIAVIAFALVTMNAWADETNIPREADETNVLRVVDFEKLVVLFDRVCGELPTGRMTPVDYVRMQEFARAIRDRLKSELQEGYRVDGQQLAEDLQTYFKKYVDFKKQYGLEHPATQSALRTVSLVVSRANLLTVRVRFSSRNRLVRTRMLGGVGGCRQQ